MMTIPPARLLLAAAALRVFVGSPAGAQEIMSSDAVVQAWALTVRSKVAESAYRHKGPEATVAVGFTLLRDGAVANIRVLDASDDRVAALATQVIQESAPFPPMPGAVSADLVPFTIKLHFAGSRPRRRPG